MRIASLCPSNTELLAFVGLADRIVGVDKYSDWPQTLNNVPRLGSDMDIDMDALEALRPDLVVASLSVPGMERNIERLEERKLPYIVLDPNSLADIGSNMLTVGAATDTLAHATAARERYEHMLDQYREISRAVTERPRLYWEWWPKPVFTPGGANWLTEISELAGAVNVFADDERASVQTDWEDVVGRDPDYILLAWVGIQQHLVKPNTVSSRLGGSELRAVRDSNVLVMEEPLYCRPSPRLVAGLSKLAAALHPDHYPAYDEAKLEEWLA
ncbi:cobalamin-binding protein [Paenibacillus sp. CCS19]|uniref:cobalamin-binding protein n=1 Tax=Paenibacillus sp. CCS19 TaxID=3158387 RepID=UPI00256895B1|nr:cobalamin-binding protein [Paenibacillus cellulosilyticus]GMK39311.1 cobalamin-binding protein [Paenibacillus cellulosilyticus]